MSSGEFSPRAAPIEALESRGLCAAPRPKARAMRHSNPGRKGQRSNLDPLFLKHASPWYAGSQKPGGVIGGPEPASRKALQPRVYGGTYMYDDSIRSTVSAQASRLSIQESLQTEFRRHALGALKVFGASVVLFILGGTIATAFPELRILAGTAFGFAFLAACFGLVQGIRALSRPKAHPIRIGLPILIA